MSQKQNPQEPAVRSGQQQTQQSSGRQPGRIQQGRLDFEDTLTRDMRVALHDIVQAATICNYCADACLGKMEMEECARLCRDVGDLAAMSMQFLSRNSIFAVDVLEAFAYAAEECEQVCSQYPHDHCQECASALRRATDSSWAVLDSRAHIGQGSQQYNQPPQQPQQY